MSRGSQCHFFALPEDLRPVLAAVEATQSVHYTLMGHYPAGCLLTYTRSADIEDLGLADADSSSACKSYLVRHAREHPSLREVAPGRFAIDQLHNPESVTLACGGIWRDILLRGRVAAAHRNPVSDELMSVFKKAIRTRFERVQAFYVGEGALTWLRAGRRLTIAEQSPLEFDLRLNGTGA